jgi:uncharacterized membrane protein
VTPAGAASQWRTASILRGVVFASALVGYAALCHSTNCAPGPSALGAILALAPLAAAAGTIGHRVAGKAGAAGAMALLCVAAGAAWPQLERHFPWLYLCQDSILYALLAAPFLVSLVGRRTPLCTVFADRMHGPLDAAERRYTRGVTVAWGMFLAALAVLMPLLYVSAPRSVWSAFANFCALPLVLVMFLGERLVRRRMLPATRGGGLIATLRMYFVRSA